MKRNDYVIVSEKNKERESTSLVRVTSVSPDTIVGRLEKDPHIKSESVSFSPSAVLVNLGSNPRPGRVYGKDVSFLYRKSIEIDDFGTMHLFAKPPEGAGTLFRSGCEQVYRALKHHGLQGLLDSGIIWQLVTPETAGKYSGMYTPSRGEKPPRISITLDEKRLKESSIADYAYVIAHELGHALHFQNFRGTTLDKEWLDMYTNTVMPVPIPKSAVIGMRDSFIASQSTLSAFKSTLSEDEVEILKVVIGEIRRTSRLSPREIDTLSQSSGAADAISRAWPNHVCLSKLAPLLTQYSLKSYYELFAESFAFFLLGRKLPRPVAALMDRTVRRA